MAKEHTERLWTTRVAAWRASGLTAVDYCVGREFTVGGLRHWAHVLKKRGVRTDGGSSAPQSTLRLVKLETVAAAASPSTSALTIELGVARLTVPAGFDSATLRAVIEALSVVAAEGRR